MCWDKNTERCILFVMNSVKNKKSFGFVVTNLQDFTNQQDFTNLQEFLVDVWEGVKSFNP